MFHWDFIYWERLFKVREKDVRLPKAPAAARPGWVCFTCCHSNCRYAWGKGRRFPEKSHIIGILFIVFDIETLFLIPWAVIYRDPGVFGFVEGLFFVVTLGVGLLYAWKKGALEWE